MRGMQDGQLITGAVTIRRLDGAEDALALERLAGLDSGEPIVGPALGVEVEGRLLAAISLEDRHVLSDPFSHTAELRSLLELRAAQVEQRTTTPGRRRFVIRTPSRAGLASSPPGAGGRLLTLLPRI